MTFPNRQSVRHFFEVILVLVSRDQKSRYKTTAMGVIWAVASPVLFLVTFYFLFTVVVPLGIDNYASFLFIGIVVWTWLQASVLEAVPLIPGNPSLVSQPRFPKSVLPVATVLSGFLTFLMTLPLLFLILWFEGHRPGIAVIALPILMVCQFIFTLGCAYFVASLNVTFRDTQYIAPIILQLAYFATPVFYDIKTVPEKAQMILGLNPMLHIIEGYRAILIGGMWPDWKALIIVFLFSLGLLLLTSRYFRKSSLHFLEEI